MRVFCITLTASFVYRCILCTATTLVLWLEHINKVSLLTCWFTPLWLILTSLYETASGTKAMHIVFRKSDDLFTHYSPSQKQSNLNKFWYVWTVYTRVSGATYVRHYKKVKVAHTRLPSVGLRSWFRFLAVSLQVTWIINPAVGCHYLPPGPQLPLQSLQEAQLSPSDRAMRLVSSNLASCHATVQKLLIRQVLTKLMVWSWKYSRRQCVMNNVQPTMTRPSRLPLSHLS